MDINQQKYVRTGDIVVSTLDDRKKIVHYVVNHEDQMSFDEPMNKIKKLIVDGGDKIEHLSRTQFKLP